MHGYSCLFLQPDGGVAAREEFEAETDNDAVVVARALYAERAARDGLELWDEARRIHSEDER
ncbi:MAG TPA: hypothetical protein VHX19_16625 [Stellaceae bacterium]|jgi:hypothetical protein|nr:hypothetical protein [Stellaceae bacterium]